MTSANAAVERFGLSVPTVVPFEADAESTLAVVVDVENEFCDPAGGIYLGAAAERAAEVTQPFVERARAAGCRILWIRSVRDEAAVEFSTYGVDPHLLRGTWATEFTPPCAPADRDAVIEKQSHDCFNATALDGWLSSERITAPEWSVLVAGVALDVCVNHAVLGFSVRGYRVGVMLDAVAPTCAAGEAATLWRYGIPAYDYNIAVTRTDLVHLRAQASE